MASGKLDLDWALVAGSKSFLTLNVGEVKTVPYQTEHRYDSIIFSNWNDSTNFPELYGSGIIFACVDSDKKRILYVTGVPNLYVGTMGKNGDTVTITWKKATLT